MSTLPTVSIHTDHEEEPGMVPKEPNNVGHVLCSTQNGLKWLCYASLVLPFDGMLFIQMYSVYVQYIIIRPVHEDKM